MSEIRPFEYDPELRKAVAQYLSDRIDYSTGINLPVYQLWDFLDQQGEKAIRRKLTKPATSLQLLYYFCIAHRRMDSGFFPPQDLLMLMANLAGMERLPAQVNVEDIRLFPAAILLASWKWKIFLPPSAADYKKGLSRFLAPEYFSDQAESPDRPVIYLRGDPRQEEMSAEAGKGHVAYYLTNWDFLGVKGNEYYRRPCLEKMGISAIIQIPRPKRQGMSIYPAIIKSGGVADTIRMAQIRKIGSGDGAIDQEAAISLIRDKPDGITSKDVEKAAIAADSSCNLTPAFWLTGTQGAVEASTIRLGDCAQIIRCQVPRTKYHDAILEYGPQPNRVDFVAREAGMASLQSQCGFLMDGEGVQVILKFKRKDNKYKYLLKANDIMFAFRGTSESLGKVGFVNDDPVVPSITGTAFYIIRSLGTLNPVWLYWQLQTEEMRKVILARASGTSMLNISVEDTKNLSIRKPETGELEKILEAHFQISMRIQEISRASKIISTEVINIKSLQE